jgi:hypothetical protein
VYKLSHQQLSICTTLRLQERESIDGKGYGISPLSLDTITDTSQATSALYVTAVKQAVQGVMAAYKSNSSEVERSDMTVPHDNIDEYNSEKSKVYALHYCNICRLYLCFSMIKITALSVCIGMTSTGCVIEYTSIRLFNSPPLFVCIC